MPTIVKTPLRISFFGGGTDYPVWFRGHGGAVLSTSIDKYCYITCRYLPPFFEHRIRVMYSKIECVQNLDEIQHPAVREVLRYLQINRGVEITPEVADGEHSAILDQVNNGLFVRMAALSLLDEARA